MLASANAATGCLSLRPVKFGSEEQDGTTVWSGLRARRLSRVGVPDGDMNQPVVSK